MQANTAVEWIHHTPLPLSAVTYWILSILPWSTWVWNLQSCAKPSFSLLLILCSMKRQTPPSWPGLMRGKSCCFIAAAASRWGVWHLCLWTECGALWFLDRSPAYAELFVPALCDWAEQRRGTQCGPEQRCPVARREREAKTKLDFYLGSRQHLFTSRKKYESCIGMNVLIVGRDLGLFTMYKFEIKRN